MDNKIYRSPYSLGEEKKQKTPIKTVVYEHDNIKIETNTPYEEVMSLSRFRYGKHLDFEKPTPIQRYTISALENNHPVLVRAPTGMGKTLCFLIPLMENLKYTGIGPQICVLVPVRELAEQIKEVVQGLLDRQSAGASGVRGGWRRGNKNQFTTDVLYGEKFIPDSIKKIDILIATPGRLKEFLTLEKISFGRLKYLVLDEADRLLDMGFEADIRDIKSYVPETVKTSLFSATYQKSVNKLIDVFLPKDRVVVEVKNETLKNVRQYIYNINERENTIVDELSKLNLSGSWSSQSTDKVIIFTEQRVTTEKLLQRLLYERYVANSLHGEKPQDVRKRILKSFRDGNTPILIATSIAARGIDVNDVKLVVNYDMPRDSKDYIHRIGRTGRGEGSSGKAISFIDTSKMSPSFVSELIDILKESENGIPEFLTNIRGSRRHNEGRKKQERGYHNETVQTSEYNKNGKGRHGQADFRKRKEILSYGCYDKEKSSGEKRTSVSERYKKDYKDEFSRKTGGGPEVHKTKDLDSHTESQEKSKIDAHMEPDLKDMEENVIDGEASGEESINDKDRKALGEW